MIAIRFLRKQLAETVSNTWSKNCHFHTLLQLSYELVNTACREARPCTLDFALISNCRNSSRYRTSGLIAYLLRTEGVHPNCGLCYLAAGKELSSMRQIRNW